MSQISQCAVDSGRSYFVFIYKSDVAQVATKSTKRVYYHFSLIPW